MPLEYALQSIGKNPDPGPWKLPRSFTVRPSAPLGISDLPVQRQRRSKHRPYLFNVMVVGESGLGKTTFMNSLFNTDLVEEIPGLFFC
jgi:type IV secretory pathway VirB4 component